MNRHGLTLLEVLVIFIVVFIVVGVLVPVVLPPGGCGGSRRMKCANNLLQLYKLGTVYASSHQGNWPETQGEDLWRSFSTTKPPLIEPEALEILCCPFTEDFEPGRLDYRGPRAPFKAGPAEEPLGADKPGNHGDDQGGNVLLKTGEVREAGLNDALWKQCVEKLRP